MKNLFSIFTIERRFFFIGVVNDRRRHRCGVTVGQIRTFAGLVADDGAVLGRTVRRRLLLQLLMLLLL